MATASALTNTFSAPGTLMAENFVDVLNSQFKFVNRRVWQTPVQGLKYWNVMSTARAYEKHSYVVGGGIVPKNRDVQRIPRDTVVQGFDNTYTPETYRLAMFIEKRLRETDQFNVIDKMMADLNQSAKDTIELYAALPFNSAFSATVSWVAADGMNLCDKSRPMEVGAAGTWDNEETSAALSQAAIATMRLNFRKNKNGRGRIRPITMKSLVIPPDLEDTAIEEMKSVLKAGVSTNETNFLTQYGLSYEVWEYLTSTTAYFGMGAKDSLYELNWYWGSKPNVDVSDVTSTNPDVYGKRVRMNFVTGADRPHSVRGNVGT